MSPAVAARLEDAPPVRRTRRGHWPTIRAAASCALLSAFLFRQSAVIAPGWNLAAVSWTLSFLVLYFGLARAVFVRTHCTIHGRGAMTDATMARGEFAFAAALRRRRQGLLLLSAALLLVAAAVDYAAIGASFQARRPFVLGMGATMMLFWLVWCPVFLVACSLWVTEPDVTLRRARGLLRGRAAGQDRPAWWGVVAAVALTFYTASALVEPPLTALALALVPGPKTVYFLSVVFLAAQIAFQYWIQAVYAAWLTPRLVRRAREAA